MREEGKKEEKEKRVYSEWRHQRKVRGKGIDFWGG